MISCLWDGAYKRTLADKLERVAHVVSAGFLSHCLSEGATSLSPHIHRERERERERAKEKKKEREMQRERNAHIHIHILRGTHTHSQVDITCTYLTHTCTLKIHKIFFNHELHPK